MGPTEFEDLILAGDWSAVDEAAALRSLAMPVLKRQLRHPERGVRLVVVLCLEQVGGPEAATELARAINDDEEQVRGYAADLLLVVNDPSVLPAMERAVAGHEDPRIRAKAALVVGVVGAEAEIEPLRRALAFEEDAVARDCIQQAMARLGDTGMTDAILEDLDTDDTGAKYRALGRIEYIGNPAHVPRIAPLLEDPSVVTVLTDGGAAQEVLRLNDAAGKTIAVLLNQPFSFELSSYRPCTDHEIREVKHHLDAHGLR